MHSAAALNSSLLLWRREVQCAIRAIAGQCSTSNITSLMSPVWVNFVEENFYNVGIGDHPLRLLGRLVRNDPNFHDEGRKEITFRDEDTLKFRVITLRKLKDARTFFHNGSFTKVRDARTCIQSY